MLYEINESTANAACLTASAVAVGSIANILSGVSSSFTHAFLTCIGAGVSFSTLFILAVHEYSNSHGYNYCHKDAYGWPIVCYGEDHFTHLVVAHGIFASATFPALFLTLIKAASISNKVTTYIVDKFVKIRTVSVANILNYLSPSISRKSSTPFATDGLIEV
ncbi:hypothetical protein [Endozoicomonas sp.]|uniref:hypothetical protein n=1 Tax=Endozoicomonas sp. TaxID=1892382 RepID=UPI00383B0AE4